LPSADPPQEWSEERNVRWKVRLPGLGHSTPIISGDRLFVTAAEPVGEKLPPRFSGAPGAHDNLAVTRRHEFLVLAIERATGAIAWKTKVHAALPHEGGHTTGSLASASPVTDGAHVFAYFGSHGLYCLDLSGKVVWQVNLGVMHSKHGHGEGSSPALSGDVLIVNWDHEGQSFLAAFDKHSGRQRWKVPRDEVTSWSTPLIVTVDDRRQVIVNGTSRVRGYDVENGDVVWECGGLSANVVATPVASEGIVYVGSSYDTRNMLAIRLAGAHGDITDSEHVLWSRSDRTPYVPSPLLYGDFLYFLRHYQGILTRVDAKSGIEAVGPFRLGSLRNIYASPVGAANRVYITDLNGVTQVVSHGAIPRLIAVNRLADSFSASAAIADQELYLRGREFLYCLAVGGQD
jgi:outer membrane protein assembly factor BamB